MPAPYASPRAERAEDLDNEDVRRLALLADRKDRKDRQRYHEMVMEELVPKPTGRYGGVCAAQCKVDTRGAEFLTPPTAGRACAGWATAPGTQ